MNDLYMYSHSSRFTGTLTGQPQYNNRFGMPFQMNTSAQHKQFHEMKAEMPSDVLELFKANQIAFLRAPVKPKCRSLDPVTTTCKNIHAMFDIPNENLMEKQKGQTRQEKRIRIAGERRQRHNQQIGEKMENWNPFVDDKVTSDPEKTLIVARLNYTTTQKNLKFEFEKYGIIKSVRIVRDKDGDSRGYGFVQFDSREDFVNAYKNANYRKIDGQKIVVDFEKGRTLLKWRPRRFGGGKGYLRLTRSEIEVMEREERNKKRDHDHQSRERSRSLHRRKVHEDKEKEREKDKKKEKRSSKEKKEKKQKKEKKDKKQKKEKQLEVV